MSQTHERKSTRVEQSYTVKLQPPTEARKSPATPRERLQRGTKGTTQSRAEIGVHRVSEGFVAVSSHGGALLTPPHRRGPAVKSAMSWETPAVPLWDQCTGHLLSELPQPMRALELEPFHPVWKEEGPSPVFPSKVRCGCFHPNIPTNVG